MSEPNDDTPNEIVTETKAAIAHRRTAKARTKSWPIARIGLAAGIGSAAVAAAVLFAGRGKDGDR